MQPLLRAAAITPAARSATSAPLGDYSGNGTADGRRRHGETRRIGIGLASTAVALMVWAGAAGATTIKGRVTDEAGEPIPGITVCAEAPEGIYPGGCAWDGTDAEGRYAIEGLVAGGYLVGFFVEGNPSLNYVPQWYSRKAHPEEGIRVASEGGVAEGIDAVMQTGGQIVGTVTDRATGLPIEGVEVCTHQVGYFQTGEVSYCDRTDAAGEYDVKNKGTGEYRVEFGFGGAGPNYVAENYPANVAVTAGQVTGGINAQMSGGLQIEGNVIDAATGRAPEYPVPAYGSSVTIPMACALEPVTERRVECAGIENGHYVLPGLPLGMYVVSFALDSFEDRVDIPDG